MNNILVFMLFISFVPLCLIGIKLRKQKDIKEKLITIDESNYLKGFSAIGVFLAHAYYFFKDNQMSNLTIYFPFSVLGGMGVLLFFFVGGYGIYKSFSKKGEIDTKEYWKKRLANVYIPSMIIEFIIVIIIKLIFGKGDIWSIIKTTLIGAWYIDVVMLEYLFFYFSALIFKKKKNGILIAMFILNSILFIIFSFTGLEERWKNGLFLYVFGILIACYEKKITKIIYKHRIIILFTSLIVFGITGSIFSILKGMVIADVIKNISGCSLAITFISIFYLFEMGNRVILYFGKRSLYIYLVHLGCLEIINYIGPIKYAGIQMIVVALISVIISELLFFLIKLLQKSHNC